MQQRILLRAYTIRELAAIYGVSVKVLKPWLRDIVQHTGEKRGRFYTARQVSIIFNYLGVPFEVGVNDRP